MNAKANLTSIIQFKFQKWYL